MAYNTGGFEMIEDGLEINDTNSYLKEWVEHFEKHSILLKRVNDGFDRMSEGSEALNDLRRKWNKPHWIPGAPTKPGWCWVNIEWGKNRLGYSITEKMILEFSFDSDLKRWFYNDGLFQRKVEVTFNILAHCPLEEPEE